MIHQIVGRCHVSLSNRAVIKYLVSRFKPGAWRSLTRGERKKWMREAIRCHSANRRLYRDVMSGGRWVMAKQRTYQIAWDNGHASGVLDGSFTNRREAERAAAAWKREMVAIETTPQERKEARAAYQWEIVEQEVK